MLLKKLNKKYPLQYTSIRGAFFISFYVGSLLLVLEPFGLVNSTKNKFILCSIFSLITFVSILLTNSLKKNILKENMIRWTILKEFIFLNFVVLTIASGNYLYLSYILNSFHPSIFHFIITIFLTLCIAITPIGFVTFYRYNNLRKTDLGKIINSQNEDFSDNEILKFISLNKTDDKILIRKKDLLFIEVVKNSIFVYYYEKQSVKTISTRNTLKVVEKEFKKDKTLFKCHRSFIVNTQNIKTAKGNSNGYKIYFKNYEGCVPVSRSYAKIFQNLIN